MAVRFRCPRQDCHSDRCPAKKIFSCLSPAQDAQLGRERLARRYDAGQTVIHHDTPALGVLAVHSGQVKLTRSCRNGERVLVGLRGPGELLGAREVLSGVPYQVSIETLESSVLCAVPREAFLECVRDCPELAMRLLGQLSRDYLRAEEQLVARVHLSVRSRTARLLMTLIDPTGTGRRNAPGAFDVTMDREEMALLVGTTRESLSRSLSQFAARGVIATRNGGIRVLSSALLEAMAE